ncbi:MAG: site-specific integrase [Chthoniobacteraceae bacterium]|nr:site-specific integrase [Chthoniobacteraceae bacterium]
MKETLDPRKYYKVRDDRNRLVPGLYKRNKSFYAQMRLPGKGAKRIPLKYADGSSPKTVPQAIAEMNALVIKLKEGKVNAPGTVVVTVAEAIKAYQTERDTLGTKAPATLLREDSGLAFWEEFCGSLDVSKVTMALALEFAVWRRGGKVAGLPLLEAVAGRSVDLDVMAMRYVLKKFGNDSFKKWAKLAGKPRRIRLMDVSEIDALCETAEQTMENHSGQAPSEYGQQFSDYLRLLALTGAREKEALHLRRGSVDWTAGHIRFDVTKNKKSRTVDMGPALRAHLEGMWLRRGWERVHSQEAGDALLFPSPRSEDVLVTWRKSLKGVMKRAGVKDFGFHHLRHYFISQCVMIPIDYMTIAAWVGHQDGGVLIGKVYGHLNNEHRKRQADKLGFGPAVVPAPLIVLPQNA